MVLEQVPTVVGKRWGHRRLTATVAATLLVLGPLTACASTRPPADGVPPAAHCGTGGQVAYARTELLREDEQPSCVSFRGEPTTQPGCCPIG